MAMASMKISLAGILTEGIAQVNVAVNQLDKHEAEKRRAG
jgi:hypothetical protein